MLLLSPSKTLLQYLQNIGTIQVLYGNQVYIFNSSSSLSYSINAVYLLQ